MPSPSSEKTTQSGDTPTASDLRSPKTSLNVAHIVSILTKHSCEYTPEKAAMMLGESPLVAIGEGTHRSKEMFDAQYDIIKQRIEKHACRVVFIEADASDVSIIIKAAEAGDMERTRDLLEKEFSVHSIGKNILTDHFAYIRLSNVCNGILLHRNITPETWAQQE